jgi:hypothetical protein
VSKPATPSDRPDVGGSCSRAPSIARAADAGCDLPDAGIAGLGDVPGLAEVFRSGIGKSGLVLAAAGPDGGGLDPVAPLAGADAEGLELARRRLAAVGLSIPLAAPAPA